MAILSTGARNVLCLSTLVGIGAIAQSFAADNPVLLTEKPAEAAAAMQFEAHTSTIAPTVEIPYSLVAQAANAAADGFAGPRSGHTRIGCQNVGFGGSLPVKVTLFKGCADFDWNVTASRNGNIVVKRAGDGITLDVPVKFTGTGNFTGELSRAIKTPTQNFSGTFVVSIAGQVMLDKSFCPKVQNPTAHFAWGTAPDIDILGRSCLDVGHNLNACIGPWKFPAGTVMAEQINKSLAGQVDTINQKIPCNAIRGPLQQVWKNWSLPVPLLNPPVYVTIQPKALSVTGITPMDNGIKMTARLDAVTGVSSKGQATQPLPLPENVAITGQESHFSVALPLPVPYQLLAAAGSGGIVGKPIKSGKKHVTPLQVEIIPSHDQLALGITVRNDSADRHRGATGTIWYTASPVIDHDGHAIRLGNVTMTKKIDAPMWHDISDEAAHDLGTTLGNSYSYDFSPLLQQGQNALNKALADPKNMAGLKIAVANNDLKLDRTANLPNSFVIETLFTADVGVALPGANPDQPPQQQ
ncbi:MAG TPA: DUF4403 family protein [Rhizomicrobium sp.]|jgi:hypothetical protein|nr:DUF4403 family protein [Rhizomicrobium sp.]